MEDKATTVTDMATPVATQITLFARRLSLQVAAGVVGALRLQKREGVTGSSDFSQNPKQCLSSLASAKDSATKAGKHRLK